MSVCVVFHFPALGRGKVVCGTQPGRPWATNTTSPFRCRGTHYDRGEVPSLWCQNKSRTGTRARADPEPGARTPPRHQVLSVLSCRQVPHTAAFCVSLTHLSPNQQPTMTAMHPYRVAMQKMHCGERIAAHCSFVLSTLRWALYMMTRTFWMTPALT